MQICAIGLHRNTVSQEIWAQVPVGSVAIARCREALAAARTARESLLVVSGHSIEIFALVAGDIQGQKKALERFLAGVLQEGASARVARLHVLEGPDAVRHFFNLAIGIEPVGGDTENDFLECAGRAVTHARELDCIGPVLNRLYQSAILLAAQVENVALSIDSGAVCQQIENLMMKIFGSLESISVLLVGENTLGTQLRELLSGRSLREIVCVSDASCDRLGELLHRTRVVLRVNQDCAAHFTAQSLQRVMSQRRNQPLLIVTLDPTIAPDSALAKIYNLFGYDITDFQQIAAPAANGSQNVPDMVEHAQKEFFSWYYSKEHYRFGEIIGTSGAIEGVLELIARISVTDITVLIQGESGTGKELIARAIHSSSTRRTRPFITLNCGALPETLLESELFGHERGAFTGAVEARTGLLEEADGGTLLLDEIGDTSPAFQVKLLRVLQEGEMRRVGSTRPRRIDVRIIAATNRRLSDLVARGDFRTDLYYRLNVVQIDLPTLRERQEDVALLAGHFLEKYARRTKKRITGFRPESRELLERYAWPGNVRELENAIEHAVALCVGHAIAPEDLPPQVRERPLQLAPAPAGKILPLKALEKRHITAALEHYAWDYDRVAAGLGIGRTTLWRKIKEYEIRRAPAGDSRG